MGVIVDCSSSDTDEENIPPDELRNECDNVEDEEGEFVVVRSKKYNRQLKLSRMNKLVASPSKKSHVKLEIMDAPLKVKDIDESVNVKALIYKTNHWKLRWWKQKSPQRKWIFNHNISVPPELRAMPHISKYWAQRYQLFSKYDEGIRLDEESWYSVTPEKIAEQVAQKCRCDIVLDAFCGVGGNAIQFALTCGRVIAVDIDRDKIAMARHNARVYGVEHKIDFIIGDFFQVVPYIKADVVFLSPPWGGPKYVNQEVFDLKKMGALGSIDGLHVFDIARSITENIAYFVPRNSNREQLKQMAGPTERVMVEQNELNFRIKSLTAYYGDLVATV